MKYSTNITSVHTRCNGVSALETGHALGSMTYDCSNTLSYRYIIIISTCAFEHIFVSKSVVKISYLIEEENISGKKLLLLI